MEEIYQLIGCVFVWLITGIGSAFILFKLTVFAMNLFIRYKKQWQGFIQFIRYRKEFFEWYKEKENRRPQ